MVKLSLPQEEYVVGGHVGCLGCGAVLAMRYLLKGLGPRTILSIPACCWAVLTGSYPRAYLNVPFVNTAFESTGASIAGIRAALDIRGVEDVTVVGFAGDGGTADIGLQALSGMLERGDNAIYVMYDNEAYMNTGTQRSGSTPLGAWTTTTPVGGAGRGKEQPKKDMMGIILAHRVPYAATASVAFPEDLVRKARKAREIAGPTFLHIFSPCPPGWRFSSEKSVEIARLAVDAKVFPLYEVEEGTYRINRNPRKPIPVSDYMSLQERFGHLTKKMMELFQAEVDRNWEMLLRMVEITEEKPLWG
ncbi:MAG: 3-methyl-2-oxobutanoate dehydrogenase subunit beta [Candidatus Thermoplasmatota archaeon]|nr:3-methyl-2-oxobutanoate dehydrogenase subunit beta [Candidatus Thermoplasmatota archaeon]